MADAMVLIVFILFMWVLINEIEEHLILLLIGLMFMLLGIDVLSQTFTGSYDQLFTAAMPVGSTALQQYGLSTFFLTIPLFAFSKVVIRRMQGKVADQTIPAAGDE